MFMFVFVINFASADECAFIVKANDLPEACRNMHERLRKENPKLWSADWKDLLYDVKEGNQTCYGPYTQVPIVRHNEVPFVFG